MDRIEATEKAMAILGYRFEGIQVMIDISKRGGESVECTVFWREHPDAGYSMVWDATLEGMIEKLEAKMAVIA